MHDEPYAGISRELSPQALNKAMLEAVDFIRARGWDAPPTLFGLVPTALIQRAHTTSTLDHTPLTLVVQELPPGLPPGSEELGDYIIRITWPNEVVGAILAQEIQFLDSSATKTPATPQPARLFSGVLKNNAAQLTLLQVRPTETESATQNPQVTSDGELRGGPGVASGVIAALQATFE